MLAQVGDSSSDDGTAGPVFRRAGSEKAPPRANIPDEDRDTIERVRSGDSSAFEWLYRTHVRALIGYAASVLDNETEAQDAVQEVFAGLWRGRMAWDPRGPVVGYLFRAVRNKCHDHIRHGRVIERASSTAESTSIHPAMGETEQPPDQAVEHRELEAAMAAAINALDERRRLALTLRISHQLNYAEIARVLQTSEQAAMLLVTRARNTLRQAYESLRSK